MASSGSSTAFKSSMDSTHVTADSATGAARAFSTNAVRQVISEGKKGGCVGQHIEAACDQGHPGCQARGILSDVNDGI